MTATTDGYVAMAIEVKHGTPAVKIAMLLNLRRRTEALLEFAREYDSILADAYKKPLRIIDCALGALLLDREMRKEQG